MFENALCVLHFDLKMMALNMMAQATYIVKPKRCQRLLHEFFMFLEMVFFQKLKGLHHISTIALIL